MSAALAVVRGVERVTDVEPSIRWPNDVMAGDRKLAGILVEARMGSVPTIPVAIGVGLNCLQQAGSYQGDNTVCTPNPCPQPPINDICATAIPIHRCASGTLLGTTLLANPNYDPGEPWPSCTGSHEWGPDVVYRFDLFRGDALSVTLIPFRTDAGIYLVTDCADVHGSCVAGADMALYAQPEYLNYTVQATGAYFLIIDGYYQYAAGEFQLDYQMVCSTTDVPETSASSVRMWAAPSPFKQTTTLGYRLAQAGEVHLEILDAAGRRLRTLLPAGKTAASGTATWDGRDERGRDLPPGVYLAKLSSASGGETRTLVKTR